VERIRIGILSRIQGRLTGEPAELVERRKRGIPIRVQWVEKGKENFIHDDKPVEATRVGKERKVRHPAFYDYTEYAVDAGMTEIILREKVDANAVYVNREKFTLIEKTRVDTSHTQLQ
jgi:hypothetical protein